MRNSLVDPFFLVFCIPTEHIFLTVLLFSWLLLYLCWLIINKYNCSAPHSVWLVNKTKYSILKNFEDLFIFWGFVYILRICLYFGDLFIFQGFLYIFINILSTIWWWTFIFLYFNTWGTRVGTGAHNRTLAKFIHTLFLRMAPKHP